MFPVIKMHHHCILDLDPLGDRCSELLKITVHELYCSWNVFVSYSGHKSLTWNEGDVSPINLIHHCYASKWITGWSMSPIFLTQVDNQNIPRFSPHVGGNGQTSKFGLAFFLTKLVHLFLKWISYKTARTSETGTLLHDITRKTVPELMN